MIKFIENKNIKIYLKEDVVKDSNQAILLIHGLAEHSGRYNEFVKILNDNNISVFSMDLRGHGQTVSKKGDISSWKHTIEDVDKVIDYIKQNYNFDKLGIFGHSLGGLIASLYASMHGDKISFIILSSPAIYCPKKLKFLRFLPYKLLSFIYVKKKHSESKEMLEVSRNDKFALHKYSIRMIGVFFIDAIKALNKICFIDKPLLLVRGKQDNLLNEQMEFRKFFDKLDNDKNKMIVYENTKHRIVQNNGCEGRIKDIIDWTNIL